MKPLLVLVLTLALAGCGGAESDGDADAPATTASPSLGAPIPGGGLSIEEAKASTLDGPLMVRGYLIERDGELRLCEAILESSPPQCGEPSLLVDGPAPDASEERVSLLGEVDDGTIVVSSTAQG
jgi:hypothetical protein